MTRPLAWPAGHALRHLDEIDSTNEEAKRLAAEGIQGPLWILADRQVSGRGRQGRVWHSLTGNLSATLLINPRFQMAIRAQLSFVASLAAYDLIAHHVPIADVKLKWPNDVLAHGRKIAGILLESSGDGANPPNWLAIGFGVNLVWHPTDSELPATSLLAAGAHPPSAPDALARLAASWEEWYDVWQVRGFASIREGWLGRAAGLGERVRARLPGGEIVGMFEGIDENGALLLRERSDKLTRIAAGDVFV